MLDSPRTAPLPRDPAQADALAHLFVFEKALYDWGTNWETGRSGGIP